MNASQHGPSGRPSNRSTIIGSEGTHSRPFSLNYDLFNGLEKIARVILSHLLIVILVEPLLLKLLLPDLPHEVLGVGEVIRERVGERDLGVPAVT